MAAVFFSEVFNVLGSSSIVGRRGDWMVELRRFADDRLLEPGSPKLLLLPAVVVLFSNGWVGSSVAPPLATWVPFSSCFSALRALM